jgi:hypothetical protein
MTEPWSAASLARPWWPLNHLAWISPVPAFFALSAFAKPMARQVFTAIPMLSLCPLADVVRRLPEGRWSDLSAIVKGIRDDGGSLLCVRFISLKPLGESAKANAGEN